MENRLARLLLVALAGLLSACAALETTPSTSVHQPMTARPEARPAGYTADGGIYHAAYARPLFEDRRARYVGDTITINLVENTSAKKATNASANRASSMSGGITGLAKLPLAGLAGMKVDAGTSSDFSGKGAAAANNAFTGTITVTVIEVYPNGNLLVSGEKEVAINQGQEFIRFSGVINASQVTASNSVQSTQVADARIEYKGSGYIDEAQQIGWLQRFFNVVMPF